MIGSVTIGTATTDGSGQFVGKFAITDCSVTGAGTLTANSGATSVAVGVRLAPCSVPIVPVYTG